MMSATHGYEDIYRDELKGKVCTCAAVCVCASLSPLSLPCVHTNLFTR